MRRNMRFQRFGAQVSGRPRAWQSEADHRLGRQNSQDLVDGESPSSTQYGSRTDPAAKRRRRTPDMIRHKAVLRPQWMGNGRRVGKTGHDLAMSKGLVVSQK